VKFKEFFRKSKNWTNDLIQSFLNFMQEGKEIVEAELPKPKLDLPLSHRQVIELHSYGAKNKQIAKFLNMNPSTVSTIIHRCRKKGILPPLVRKENGG